MGQLKKTNIYVTGNKPPMENVVFGSPLTVTTEITDSEENQKHTWYKLTTPNPSSGNLSSYRSAKIEFTTTEDNIEVEFKIKAQTNWDGNVTIGALDYYTDGVIDADYSIATIYGNLVEKIIKYEVPTKGKHFIQFEYAKSSNNSGDGAYICAWSNLNMPISEVKSVYVENSKIQQMNVQGKNLFEYELGNTISWETLTWNKSNNSYTYNTKGKLYMSYNHEYTYLTNSPASIATKPYHLRFNNINTYYGTSYTCTYKLDLSDLDTSNINNMYEMFSQCNALTSVNVTNLNTSKVTDMYWMFLRCNSLTNLDVSNFDTSKVTDANRMFENCYLLSNIDVSRWNTSKMNNVAGMFKGCRSLTSLDLSGWDTSSISKVYDYNNGGTGLFDGCENLVDLKLPKNFITSKVTNISNMFNGCKKLTSLDLSGWDTSNITEMNNLFKNSGIKIIDISNWDLSSLEVSVDKWQIGFKDMFKDSQCETIKLPNMNFGKDVKYDFSGLSYLKSFYAPELVNTNITNADSMFFKDKELKYVDMHDWDVSSVRKMYGMFSNCSSLTSLDLSNFNTTNVTTMGDMFYNCSSLTSLDLSNLDVSNVTNMDYIFRGCTELKTLIAGHESETNVTALNGLKVDIDLSDCTKLNSASIMAICNGLANLPSDNKKTITVSKTKENDTSSNIAKLNATLKNWNFVYK